MKTDINSFINKGIELFENKDYKGAHKQFDIALAANPDNNETLIWKGMCLYHLGNFKKAIDFLRVMESWGPEPDTLSAYIECLLKEGEIKKAEKLFNSNHPDFEGEPGWEEVPAKLNMAKKLLKGTGVSSKPSLQSDWVNDLNSFFLFLKKKTKKQVGGILVEWSRDGGEPEANFYAIVSNQIVAFEKSSHRDLTLEAQDTETAYLASTGKIIRSNKMFAIIMKEACALPSFTSLKRRNPFYIIQQEHDTKLEFFYKHSE
jgi:tetratricopeptide (TPR) repeat protein